MFSGDVYISGTEHNRRIETHYANSSDYKMFKTLFLDDKNVDLDRLVLKNKTAIVF